MAFHILFEQFNPCFTLSLSGQILDVIEADFDKFQWTGEVKSWTI